MALNYENLDEKTRPFMLREVELDLSRGNLYLSPRLNEHGRQNYVSLLKEAIGHYNDAWLADQLDKNGCMAEFETAQTEWCFKNSQGSRERSSGT